TGATRRALRKQKVPRQITPAGLDLPIYRRYNWRPPARNSTESEERQKRWDYASKEATPEGMAVLERLCTAYDQRYSPQEILA
ncbi:MAG: hypothetical protein ACE5Q6_09050, partial [Dehalococcoidia bacterium]